MKPMCATCTWLYITNCVFNAFIAYASIMLNDVTIQAIRKTSSLPKPLKTLLPSLAVSDLGVVSCGTFIHWIAGQVVTENYWKQLFFPHFLLPFWKWRSVFKTLSIVYSIYICERLLIINYICICKQLL